MAPVSRIGIGGYYQSPQEQKHAGSSLAKGEAEQDRNEISSGVKLELSKEGLRQSTDNEQDAYLPTILKEQPEDREDTSFSLQSLWFQIKELFERLKVQLISFWTEKEPESVEVQKDEQIMEASPKEDATEHITEEAKDFLKDYGGRKLAKNTSIVTYYDKHGNLVEPSATDKKRILFQSGDDFKL